MDEWNPEADVDCEAPFSVVDLSGKLECKRALQKELGLPQRDDVPLMGLLVAWIGKRVRPPPKRASRHDARGCTSGDAGNGLNSRTSCDGQRACKDKFRGFFFFPWRTASPRCDILLMPSRFEPCGLNQLYAMRYGTLPIAHATGGLKDTITPHNAFGDADEVLAGTADMDAGEGVGTGWLFNDMNAERSCGRSPACDVYRTNPNSSARCKRKR